jgi:hypothetical protein
MVFAVAKLSFSVRIILTHRECEVYKPARTANYKPNWFTESAPAMRIWSIPPIAQKCYSPFILKRILDEEAIHLSLRYRSDLISPQVSCEADSEQPRDLSAWPFAAGRAGCGPASSDNAPNLESRTNVGGPPLSKQGPSRRNDAFTPAASSLPFASVNGTGSASGTGTVLGGDSPHAVHVLSSEPGHPLDGLVVPEWMAQKLNSRMFGSGSGPWSPGRSQRSRCGRSVDPGLRR